MVISKNEVDSVLLKLEALLENQSYITGYAPSQSDTAVFESLHGLQIPTTFVHVSRWHKHIASYPNTKFPGIPTTLQQLNLAPEAGHVAPSSKTQTADEDDFELFGSDDEEEDTEAERIKQERLKAYEAKKSNKPVLIAKSNIVLDVKPWDDETDMAAIETAVRSIEADGLLWGASKLVPLAYGIKKLQITCVVEDDKIGTDFLEEEITKFEDLVQSVDIAAFNKI